MSAPGPGAGGSTESTVPIRPPVGPPAAPVRIPEQGESTAPPLPRRRGQANIEPQLREPRGAGDGTPFGAFGQPDPAPPPVEPEATAPTPPIGERAAVFRAATRRGPRRGGPGPRRPG